MLVNALPRTFKAQGAAGRGELNVDGWCRQSLPHRVLREAGELLRHVTIVHSRPHGIACV